MSWAEDENADSTGCTNVTIQWNILAEGLANAGHPEQPHSMGIHAAGVVGCTQTIHHNLFVHNQSRNPLMDNGDFDVVNNVIHNAEFNGIMVTPASPFLAATKVNAVGNRYVAGNQGASQGVRSDGRGFDGLGNG